MRESQNASIDNKTSKTPRLVRNTTPKPEKKRPPIWQRSASILEERTRHIEQLQQQKREIVEAEELKIKQERIAMHKHIKITSKYKAPFPVESNAEKWSRRQAEILSHELDECSFQPNSVKTQEGWQYRLKSSPRKTKNVFEKL